MAVNTSENTPAAGTLDQTTNAPATEAIVAEAAWDEVPMPELGGLTVKQYNGLSDLERHQHDAQTFQNNREKRAEIVEEAKIVQATEDAQVRFLENITGQNATLNFLSGGIFANEDWKKITIEENGSPEQNAAINQVIKGKTPAQLIDALEAANPDSKDLLNVIRGDEALATSLHTAVYKDETMLAGLSQLTGPGSNIPSDVLVKALKDPQTRAGVVNMLDQVAENPDLKFADISEALDSGAAFYDKPNDVAAANRYKSAMSRFGLQDNRMLMAQMMSDPGAALMQMIQDPHTFFANIRLALGNIAPGGFMDGLLSTVENGIASWTQDPQIHQLMDHYNIAAGFQDVQNIQANMGIVKIAEAPTATAAPEITTAPTPVTPTISNDGASLTTDVNEHAAVTNFNQGLQNHAGIGIQVASVSYDRSFEFGEQGKGKLSEKFGSANNIVGKDDIEDFGNEMRHNVANVAPAATSNLAFG
jgi:hypothetical protein